jgi:hypothetical protein
VRWAFQGQKARQVQKARVGLKASVDLQAKQVCQEQRVQKGSMDLQVLEEQTACKEYQGIKDPQDYEGRQGNQGHQVCKAQKENKV